MPKGGSKPGEHRGGRVKGKPNKTTIEKVLLAERAVAGSRDAGKKLGREVLEDFMLLFAGMAAHYQPQPVAGAHPNEHEDKFDKYARLACETAKWLAPYQSPTYRAIMVSTPGENSGKMIDAPRVAEVDDNISDARADEISQQTYLRMIKGGKS